MVGVKKGTVRGSYTPRQTRLQWVRSLTQQELVEEVKASSSEKEFLYRLCKNQRYFKEVLEIVSEKGVSLEELKMRAIETRIRVGKLGGARQTEKATSFILENLEAIFSTESAFSPRKFRKFFGHWNRKFGWLPYRCEECDNEGSHNGKPLTLQIDHRNGIATDQRLPNIRFLCPNCHSQTETFCGRNIGKRGSPPRT